MYGYVSMQHPGFAAAPSTCTNSDIVHHARSCNAKTDFLLLPLQISVLPVGQQIAKAIPRIHECVQRTLNFLFFVWFDWLWWNTAFFPYIKVVAF